MSFNEQFIQIFVQLYSLTNLSSLKSIFFRALGQNSIRRRNRKWLTARVVFLFLVSFFLWLVFHSMAFPYRVYCNRQHMLQIFWRFSFCVAMVKLLQTLRLFESFGSNYCSAGVTELYPIFIHCETKPYLKTLPNYTQSYYITELYPISKHY